MSYTHDVCKGALPNLLKELTRKHATNLPTVPKMNYLMMTIKQTNGPELNSAHSLISLVPGTAARMMDLARNLKKSTGSWIVPGEVQVI